MKDNEPEWDYRRLGEFMQMAMLVLGLAAIAAEFQYYLGARYEARAAAGLIVHRSVLPPEGEMPADFRELLGALQTLDRDLQKTPQAKIAATKRAPVAGVQTQPALQLQPGAKPVENPAARGQLIWLSSDYKQGDPRLISIAAAGDTMMGSAWPSRNGLNPELTPSTDPAMVVGNDLADILRGADVAFVNLEGPLYDGPDGPSKNCGNCFMFKGAEYYAKILARLGIDVVSLANNHSGDFGEKGRATTIASLKDAGIAAAGLEAGPQTATLLLPSGKKVGVIAFAPNQGTLNINDIDGAAAMVAALKKTHDYVIVSFHGGAEGWNATRVSGNNEIYLGENRGNVERFAHRMIESGASIVLGHGPHVPRAVEIYRGHLIAYSLGNFWTYGLVNNYAVSGLGPIVQAWLTPDGALAGLQIHSTRQAGLGQPVLDPLNEAARYIMYLTAKDFPESATRLAGGENEDDALATDDDAKSTPAQLIAGKVPVSQRTP